MARTTPRSPRPTCRNGQFPDCETDTICEECGEDIMGIPEPPANAVDAASGNLPEHSEAGAADAGAAGWCPNRKLKDDENADELLAKMLEQIHLFEATAAPKPADNSGEPVAGTSGSNSKPVEVAVAGKAEPPVQEQYNKFRRGIGLVIWPKRHLFPLPDGVCIEFSQVEADKSNRKPQLVSQMPLPQPQPSGAITPYEMKIFGLVKCKFGHAFLKRNERCGLCGSKELSESEDSDSSKPPQCPEDDPASDDSTGVTAP